jgi:dTDP-4-dehydrorhamnose 3,5-epimerase
MTVRWNDPDIGIEWPTQTPILSEKDANAPCLREINADRLPQFKRR